jgi:hypothetical protein
MMPVRNPEPTRNDTNRTAADRPGNGATMDPMPTHKRNQRHAAPEPAAPPRSHDREAAWLVLVAMGGTTMTFNIWHATHSGMPLGLALLYGMAPVSAAMGLSHIVAEYKGGRFMKAVTFLVMLGAMALSIGATSEVIRDAAGPLRWLFGGVIDAAALVALQVILSPESRAAAKAAKKAIAEATGEATPQAIPVPSEEPSARPSEEPAYVPSQRPRKTVARVSKEPDAEKARAAYRKSVRAGQPLSDRALADLFPGRSRTWGANRIAEVNAGPMLTTQARTAIGAP